MSGESSKLTALDFITDPDPTGVLAYGVNTLDKAPAYPAGKSGKVYYSDMLEAMVPSATALSQPGALQAYIERSLERTGICQLPRGVITIPDGEKITLNRFHSGRIIGAGQSYAPTTSGSQWLEPISGGGTAAYTIIRKTGGSSEIFYCYGVNNVTMEHFSVENPGRYCFKYTTEYSGGFTSNYLKLNQVGGLQCSVFFHAYAQDANNNAADVRFNGCMFNQCDVVLKVDHDQGLNYLFDGQCFFLSVEIAVLMKGGGRVHLDNCSGHTVKTWMRHDGGGSNLLPTFRITNLFSDRPTPPSTPPVLIDFSRATGPTSAIVDGFNITDGSGEYLGHVPNYPNSGHPIFIKPTGAFALTYWDRPSGIQGAGIIVRDIDFCTMPRTFELQPISTTNPWGNQGFA